MKECSEEADFYIWSTITLHFMNNITSLALNGCTNEGYLLANCHSMFVHSNKYSTCLTINQRTICPLSPNSSPTVRCSKPWSDTLPIRGISASTFPNNLPNLPFPIPPSRNGFHNLPTMGQQTLILGNICVSIFKNCLKNLKNFTILS